MRKIDRNLHENKLDYIFHILGFFFVYGVLGFIAEFTFRNIMRGRAQEVGFLELSPILPIYGFMGMITYALIRPIEDTIEKRHSKKNQVIAAILVYIPFFALSLAILELAGGFILEHIYHMKAWNYSNKFLNFMGYISIKFTLLFSFVGTLHMFIMFYYVNSFLERFSKERIYRVIITAMTIFGLIDFFYTTGVWVF